MTNLNIIKEAIKQNCTLRNAEENLKLLQEQKEFNEQYKKELESLGVIII